MNVFRRFLALLFVAACVGAASVAPMIYADASGTSGSPMHMTDSQGGKMPCKGMSQGCFTELGCIFLVSVPTPALSLHTTTAWSQVAYDHTSEALRGRSIEPALGPPISLA